MVEQLVRVYLYAAFSSQVNANGVISFRREFHEFVTSPFPLDSADILIAPFWADIDITDSGQIFYRFSNDLMLLSRFQSDINDGSGFSPVSLFIATWDRVAAFNGDEVGDRFQFTSECMTTNNLSLDGGGGGGCKNKLQLLKVLYSYLTKSQCQRNSSYF